MMFRSVIVEDLPVAAEYLRNCCEKSGHISVQAICTTVDEAVAYLNEQVVDLVFLDVELPGGHGFDVLDRISYHPKVILTTSKTEYAYNGFEYNVSDFLKKPFTYQRFKDALQKLLDLPGKKKESSDEDHIFIKSDGKLVRLRNDDILYIESMGDYVKFVSEEKKYVALNTIKNLESRVNAQQFIKVHRSYIVNIAKVDNIKENMLYIRGAGIPVSKACKAEVIRRINII